MNIFGVGLPEVTVILILALLIFGPKKLPELGRQLGKTLKSLKKASNEFQKEIDQVMKEGENEDLPKSIEGNQKIKIDQDINEEYKEESSKSLEGNQKNEINEEIIDSENKNLLNKENSNQ